jgi:asparagine synthase (glutamine-hydrolysing)
LNAHAPATIQAFSQTSRIGICNRRLSIIDIEGGRQPVHNEDSSIWVVYNGETYNFRELRKTLQKAGHRFYTNSDTEVIVHSYEEWDIDCIQKLNGMFAFAIWDSKLKRLLIARDRTGMKPLYYINIDDAFIFASEIKAILQDNRVKIQPDFNAIRQYLNVRYFPADKTPFKNILPQH